jgi:hypothetical protein
MLHAIFLLTETAQSKVVRAGKQKLVYTLIDKNCPQHFYSSRHDIAVLFDLSWQFGFATFAAYLIGIAAAVFNVNATVSQFSY